MIGGSAGSISVLCSILKGLPSDLNAAVLAVVHISEENRHLPAVLERCASLAVTSPDNPEPIVAGKVYLPQPNRHLIVKSHCVLSWMGPRENRHRPAVDTLFRTAARVYRQNVVAVVLSGAMDDGSAGALVVKSRGGVVMVQDPRDAEVADMPENVARAVKLDFCLPAEKIPGQLADLAACGPVIKPVKISPSRCADLAAPPTIEMEPPGFTCPDCGGVLERIEDGKHVQMRCHVGHVFSLESFSEAHADALERALWVALRRLNEQRAIQESLAQNEATGAIFRKRHQENADAAQNDLRLLHEILARL
ncbi:MAG TPA: chemotaxis protein CheB [Verrucomicrobiae bacterium]